jgi:hypothetical protein
MIIVCTVAIEIRTGISNLLEQFHFASQRPKLVKEKSHDFTK